VLKMLSSQCIITIPLLPILLAMFFMKIRICLKWFI